VKSRREQFVLKGVKINATRMFSHVTQYSKGQMNIIRAKQKRSSCLNTSG
jgi:hypothetical protein